MPDKTTAAGAALQLDGLVKRYGDVVAVNGVSLDIEPGELITLLGPSGSGKTTTLNMIAGFAEVTAGSIRMAGRPIADLRPHKRGIGMVFQHYALFPHMTAYENIAYPLKQRKVPKAELRARVEEVLALVSLQDHGDRYPRHLSGGQQQRVALARAVVFSPKVLLMDEPLGALDKKLRERLQLEIKRLHRLLGTTVVYVTHDQEEALVLSDRIAVFNEGRIEQVGTSEELYERPRTRFVAEFLGESNLFAGRIDRGDREPAIVTDHATLRAPSSCDAQDGAECVLLVRPERLRVAHQPPSGADNVLDATVRQVIYLGSSRKVELMLPGDHVVVVREPAGAVTELGEGDRVHVSWGRDDGVLLPERDGAPAAGDSLAVPA